ncbi:hypothetical protein AB0D71_06490 [Streptomyces avermitilis]|uniref:hypothetical protein n=1 Tax=Streptomyces avermitilis TaxID=33903 RepID=UPI0033C6D4D7
MAERNMRLKVARQALLGQWCLADWTPRIKVRAVARPRTPADLATLTKHAWDMVEAVQG